MSQRKAEALEQNSKEDKGGLFNRHQKQVKELKQQVALLEKENERLKAEKEDKGKSK